MSSGVPAYDDRAALAMAAIAPLQAIEAAPRVDPADELQLEAPAGVHAPERARRQHGLTLAVEVDPPAPYRRWRYFIFWCLVRLAARVYPFKFEIYRTREPWE